MKGLFFHEAVFAQGPTKAEEAVSLFRDLSLKFGDTVLLFNGMATGKMIMVCVYIYFVCVCVCIYLCGCVGGCGCVCVCLCVSVRIVLMISQPWCVCVCVCVWVRGLAGGLCGCRRNSEEGYGTGILSAS